MTSAEYAYLNNSVFPFTFGNFINTTGTTGYNSSNILRCGNIILNPSNWGDSAFLIYCYTGIATNSEERWYTFSEYFVRFDSGSRYVIEELNVKRYPTNTAYLTIDATSAGSIYIHWSGTSNTYPSMRATIIQLR